MRECPSCGWSMVSTHRLEEREPRWLCVNSKCPSTHKPATLDDVLDELRAIHALLAKVLPALKEAAIDAAKGESNGTR